jgi:hypothetical protein
VKCFVIPRIHNTLSQEVMAGEGICPRSQVEDGSDEAGPSRRRARFEYAIEEANQSDHPPPTARRYAPLPSRQRKRGAVPREHKPI